MAEFHPHLILQKESPVPEKRAKNYNPPKEPSNMRRHGRLLQQKVEIAKR